MLETVDAKYRGRSPEPMLKHRLLGAVPFGFANELDSVGDLQIVRLETPARTGTLDGLVIDSAIHLPDEWARFVQDLVREGMPVYDATTVYETATERIALSRVSTPLHIPGGMYLSFKRFMDVLLVMLMLPIALPLSLVVAVLVALDSSGPILFRQQRVGKDGAIFNVIKFRSMKNEAIETARFATEEDDRITRVGQVLRHYRLDELPQLWNVLVGEMSLIGPRPEQVPFVKQFEEAIPFYGWRHRIKPGITGLAQVEQGYASGVEETRIKLEYDLYYVKHVSLILDLSILFRTIRVVFGGHGAE